MITKEDVLATFVKAGTPKRPGDIAKELAADSKEIGKLIDILKKEGRLISPKRCFYSPA